MTVIVQPRPGEPRSVRRTKIGVHFQSTFVCREGLKAPAWLFLLVLGILNSCTCADVEIKTTEVQICIKELRPAIEKSDAMLYAPSANNIKTGCRNAALKCYMLELKMVIGEEDIVGSDADCISDFSDKLSTDDSVDCPPCEANLPENTTIFMEKLQSLLEIINSLQNM